MTDDYVLSIARRAASGDAFTENQCFACGGEPTSGPGEHVIPRWLQKRFNLYNARLTLLNRTSIPYRNLTVPCCETCNGGFLRDIENLIIPEVDDPDIENSITRLTFARWLCKILVGTLVKETTLLFNRKDPSSVKIVSVRFLEEFFLAQLILQSGRKRTDFKSIHGRFPFTLYLYKIAPDADFGEFDLSTHVGGQSIAIRLGRVGAVFVNDGGLQLVAGERGPLKLDGRELHPIQFSEVAARIHYKASLRDATHTYTSFETPDMLTIEQANVRPYTSIRVEGDAHRVFRPWDDIACAEFISRYRSVDWGPVFDPVTGMFLTTLMDENGDLPAPTSIKGH